MNSPLADNPEEVVEHGSVGLAGGAGQLSQLPHVLDDDGGEQPHVGLPYTACEVSRGELARHLRYHQLTAAKCVGADIIVKT